MFYMAVGGFVLLFTCLCVCYSRVVIIPYMVNSHILFFRMQQPIVSGNMVLVLVVPEGSMAPLVSIVCVVH